MTPAFDALGLRPVLHYTPLGRLARRPDARSPADVAPVLVSALARRRGCKLVAGLVSADRRLFTVAHVDDGALDSGSPCHVHRASFIYRAVIALRARSVILAHRHGGPGVLAASPADLESTAHVYAQGFELGLELLDALIFGRDGEHLSLRALGLGVSHWRTALDCGSPDYPRWLMRYHYRRPDPVHNRRSSSACAALWRCPRCRRRQNCTRACRYCGAERPW